jgi:galactose oxidase
MSTSKKSKSRSLTRREFLTGSAALGLGFTLWGGVKRLRAEQEIKDDLQEKGLWEGPFSMPVVAVHGILLPTAEVLVYSFGGSARILNWWDWSFRPMPVPGNPNIFCSGHNVLADGTVFVTGGAVATSRGRPDAYFFDPFSETWTRLADMARGRWYPTNVLLPDGQILVVSGTDEEGRNNNIPELFAPGTWTPLTEAQLTLPNYPYLFVLPDGNLLYAGPGNPSRTFNVERQSWSSVGNSPIGGGSAVMYEPGKVLKTGGGDPSITRAVVIDMNTEAPAWREVPPMEFPRRRHNLTLLPDGKVVVMGGTRVANEEAEAVYEAEIWDPASETWMTMASMQVARMYHSIALLLPDGRVLSAGGNGKFSAEIYSPPYLFLGRPPVIESAPSSVIYGTAFEVFTSDAANIASVSLVRPSAVTHAYNQDQRYLRLSFEAGDGLLQVQGPGNPNLAPPGYYMLFILDADGVPSYARSIRLALGPAA